MLENVTVQESIPYMQRQTERRMADIALLTFMGMELPWLTPPSRIIKPHTFEQTIGQACGGTLLTQCEPLYRDKLIVACRSCPGVKHGR